MSECLHPGGQSMTRRLLQMADLPPGGQILELGCGAGQTNDYLRQLGYDALGIDLEAAGNSAHIQAGDMLHLPFPDAAFDAVVAECSLSASGDVSAALQNAYRVLKPGGHLLVSDVFFQETDGQEAQRLVQLVRQAGFAVSEWEDASREAQTFFLQMIWTQGCLPEQWKQIAAGRKKVGYFLLHGRKQQSQ